ncbi:MAG: hypothetical protein WCA35_14235 [Kovacikia sp.]
MNVETYVYPESNPTYALNLANDTAIATITHDDYEEAQLNYRKLNKLLVETQESSVFLRYENGVIRWFILILIGHFSILGYWLCFLCFVGQLLLLGTFSLNLLKKVFCRLF